MPGKGVERAVCFGAKADGAGKMQLTLERRIRDRQASKGRNY